MSPKTKKRSKIFVLDTNVILHDSSCISHFEENDIALPITVLEELDHFKRGNELINFHARDFLRHLDQMTGDIISENGVPLGDDLGTIRIIVNNDWHQDVKSVFHQDSPDHRILNAAYTLSDENKDNLVILVSKDTNVRMKAKALGMRSQDYTSDKVESVDKLYKGIRRIEDIPDNIIDTLYVNPFTIKASDVSQVSDPRSNENFILRNGQKSVLVSYDSTSEAFFKINKQTAYGIQPRNAEQSFALSALAASHVQLLTMTGKAGTGKTLLALAGALEARSQYRQIYLARPIVPLSNRDIGFLPGDIQSKIDPYMQPLFDNLNVIKHQFKQEDDRFIKINELIETQKLLITPLAYIRGRSFQKVFFIIDEAQNLTPHEIKTIITRAGEDTKIIFTGDIHQIDQPYLDSRSNGLSYLINRMVGQPMYAHITLEKGERSALAELASDLL